MIENLIFGVEKALQKIIDVEILNEELGALAQDLLVPLHRAVSRVRGTSQRHLLLS